MLHVCVISAGECRTCTNPMLVSNFHDTFSPLKPTVIMAIRGHNKPQPHNHKIHKLYKPDALVFEDDVLCKPECIDCAMKHDSKLQFVSMSFLFRRGFRELQKIEYSRGKSFSTVIKTRPDLYYFRPFPAVDSILTAVPLGIMNGDRRTFLMNDHIYICRRDLCQPYFETVSELYEQCNVSSWSNSSPQQILFKNANPNVNILIHYTIVREDNIECDRLTITQETSVAFQDCKKLDASYRSKFLNY